MSINKIIKVNENDNIGVCLEKIVINELIKFENFEIIALSDIESGHKICLNNIKKNEEIIKYGNKIGIAKRDIKQGEFVHVHNLKTDLKQLQEYEYKPNFDIKFKVCNKSFLGYKRINNKVATRNEIWIIPTVGCVNSITNQIKNLAQTYITDNIDAIVTFSNPYGCSQVGEDQINSLKIIARLIEHPNATRVLVVGLGCENNNIDILKEYIDEKELYKVEFMNCQNHSDEVGYGLKKVKTMIKAANNEKRTTIPIEKLVVGLKCGGSDGLSGISANPVVGKFCDKIILQNATCIMSEVPEMFGAEQILMNRCASTMVYKKLTNLINNYKKYYIDNNTKIHENPSPGNRQGGISTLEEKSLGCIQKGGKSIIEGIIDYGEVVNSHGLNILGSVGNDLVSSTALLAAGAHIILFTTGRGTPFSALVPTIKISSNNYLNTHKNNWIDFNAGEVVKYKTIEHTANELYDFVIQVASGKKVKSENLDFKDIAILKKGVTL